MEPLVSCCARPSRSRRKGGAVRRGGGARESSTSTSFYLETSGSICPTSSSLTHASPSATSSWRRSRSSGSGRPGVREAVADAWDRKNVVRTRRLGFDLAAQVADVDVDHPRLDRILVTPDRIEDLLAAEHLARVAGEESQQVELGMRQLDLLSVLICPALVDIDDQVAELEPAAHRFGVLHPGAA